MIGPDGFLCLNDDCRIALSSARAVNYISDRVRWRIHADRKAQSDLSLIVRMDASNAGIVAYYLLPTADLAGTKVRVLRLSSPVFAAACRYDGLEALCRVFAGWEERSAA